MESLLIGLMAIIGSACWLYAVFQFDHPLPDNFGKAPIFWLILFPIIGFVFLGIGLVALAPLAWFFHWGWFYSIFI